jgi:DNA-binding NarL/FixJ family response regulator
LHPPELLVTEPTRVMVADDSVGFREGMAALLASVDGVELVGDAVDGRQAVDRALDLQPDVILMDLHMPGRRPLPGDRQGPRGRDRWALMMSASAVVERH